MGPHGLLSLPTIVFVAGLGSPLASAQSTDSITVEVSTLLFFQSTSSQGWNAMFTGGGHLRGKVGDAAFSSRSLPAAAVDRIRGLARCVASSPEPGFEGCAIFDPPPPATRLTVRVGNTLREIGFCEDVGGGWKGPAPKDSRPALELLVAIRDLVPRGAYDYRPFVNAAVRALPSVTEACPWLARSP